MVQTRSTSAAHASAAGMDPDVFAAAVAAAVTAAMARLQTTATSHKLPSVPRFVHDTAKPNGAASWFQQLDSLFRLQTVSEEEKCALAVNALDSSTFDKVARALLPDQIETLADFKKLRDTMVGLFDYSVSLFARRYAALNLEWKGPEHETIAEYGARIKELAVAFVGVTDAEMATLMLMLGMKSYALECFRKPVLTQLKEKADTPLDECLEKMISILQTEREQKLPTQPSVNYIARMRKKDSSAPSKVKRRNTSVSSGSTASSNASSSRRGPCHSCGGNHHRSRCKFRESECYKCGEMGHIRFVCNAKNTTPRKPAVNVNTVRVSSVSDIKPVGYYATHDDVTPRINSVKLGKSSSGSPASSSGKSGSSADSKYDRGDNVLWRDPTSGSIHSGRVIDNSYDIYEIQYGEYGEHTALLKKHDVVGHLDPNGPDPSTGGAAKVKRK